MPQLHHQPASWALPMSSGAFRTQCAAEVARLERLAELRDEFGDAAEAADARSRAEKIRAKHLST